MKAATYFHTLEGAIALNRWLRWVCAGLAAAVLVLSVALAIKREAVVLVPPTLGDEARIGVSAADAEMQVSWGLYFTTLMGNVTPDTAGFLASKLGRHASPRMYQMLKDTIDQQAKEVEAGKLSISFAPRLARYEESIGKVVVTGELVVRDPRGNEAREIRTYEMGFVTQNYMVLVDSLRVMSGPWAPEGAAAAAQ